MQRPSLIFENSPFLIVLCVLGGLAYAYILYSKSGPWGPAWNKALFALRFILVTLLATLLVSPILKQVQNNIEPPTFVLAIDNSSSLQEVVSTEDRLQLHNNLSQIIEEKKDQGFVIDIRNLSGERMSGLPDSLHFDYGSSDISSLLTSIQSDYEGRNIAEVLLVSDGIYNEGIAPTYKNFRFPVNTIALGDTVPKSDISIVALNYNKVSYQGNKFPLLVQFTQRGFSGQQVAVTLRQGEKILQVERVRLGGEYDLNEVTFIVEAREEGFKRLTVDIQRLPGEFTTLNNSKQAYIEVIEGKENIALIAAAPHPDIKALRYAIESNSNYSFDQYILSLSEDRNRLKQNKKKYDLLIYHQLPDTRRYVNVLDQLSLNEVSRLYIYGGAMDLNAFNRQNKVLTIDFVPREYDNVLAAFNQSFSNFSLTDELQNTFVELPPITVPFGRISLQSGSSVMLYQQVGSIVTTKPLIAFNEESGVKEAVILGDGLWKWGLTSYVANESHAPFNELITKVVQFLSSKEDKRKFRLYPVKDEFTTNERVIFETEVYNDLYERVYGNKVDLELTDENGSTSQYNFITNENNTRYSITNLPEGVYRYRAQTELNNKETSVSGEFVVKDLEIETINLTADFNLLKKLSEKTGGNFVTSTNLNSSLDRLTQKEAQGIIRSSEQYLPFINLKWIFFLLLALVSFEWFIRKYSGSY